jgi:hypothetical protein
MLRVEEPKSRRECLRTTARLGSGILPALCTLPRPISVAAPRKARIAITLDLEMSRNFPRWQDTHWDFEKGNLDDAAKQYSVEAGKRVMRHGGSIHYFCVGRVLEQSDVSWLQEIAEAGHPIGNHTYDHVNVLAQNNTELQYRFQRAPWLIEGRTPADVIRDNIRLTTRALKQRIGVDNAGFRTPGGFHAGLGGREDLQKMLVDLGFTWVSSLYPAHSNTRADEKPSAEVYDSIVAALTRSQPFVYPTGLLEIPMSPISDIGAFRAGRWDLEWFLEAIGRGVNWAIKNHAVFDFLAHPSCLGVIDPGFKTIDLICEHVRAAGDAAELVDLNQVAATLKPGA